MNMSSSNSLDIYLILSFAIFIIHFFLPKVSMRFDYGKTLLHVRELVIYLTNMYGVPFIY